MRRSIPLFVLCSALLALAGCGNKGPLYLPNNPHPPVYVPPKPDTSPAPASTVPAPASSSSSATGTH